MVISCILEVILSSYLSYVMLLTFSASNTSLGMLIYLA